MNNIFNWSRTSNVNLWLDRSLTKQEINNCANIKQVTFEYSSKHEEEDLNEFFKNLKNRKINLIVVVRDEKILSGVRSKYFDYNVIFEDKGNYPNKEIPKNCKFLSKKMFITNGKCYPSRFSAKKLDTSNDFVYDEDSSKELENLYLYEEK